MPRHRRQQYDRLQQALRRVQGRFADSPLSAVGKKLEELITGTQEAMLREGAEPQLVSRVVDYVDHAVENLPHSFGDRFYFDAAMIQAVTEEWGQGHVHLSRMIMPRHNNRDWGHQRIPMPSEDRKNTHSVDLIRFPGEDNLDDIDLLAYPWLYHELGHNLLFRDDTVFKTTFEFRLNQITNALRLAGVADRGQARSNAHRTIDDIRDKWQPTPDHHNWAHELAIDMIALWTCGPAYLATFQGIFEDPTINPYKIDQNHPPYAVRAAALISANQRLGWDDYTQRLAQIIQGWGKSHWKVQRTNRYIALTNLELVRACVESAFETCRELILPRCSAEQVTNIRDKLPRGDVPDLGVELLLAAWMVHEHEEQSSYERWEQETVRRLLNFITP